ncbi:MAG TPA: endolytic transglycosylase MltG [Actinomycetota bacterium]|nr:endolytic transglycosylase MltG [Actinomycetota bacterium]
MLETLPKRAERKPRERRRGLVILATILILLIAFAATGVGFWSWATSAAGPKTKVVVTIPQGASGSDVASLLEQEGVIRSTWAFKLMARFRGFSGGFQAGVYTNLATNMSVEDALDALKKGPLPKKSVRALLPEGLTVGQTAARVQDQLGIRRADFMSAANSGEWSLPPYLPKGTKSLEGFMFPKAYEFEAGVTADAVVKRLLAQFKLEARDLPWSRYKSIGLKRPYDVVTVASMIEREARFPEDRPKIARVIYNRLARGMPLQIDATVQYALGAWRPLTLRDLKFESPYNTYLHQGLPPTPIASPGLASLEAALSPAKGKWLYYVVIDAQGHHAFTASYDEFLRLREQYQG